MKKVRTLLAIVLAIALLASIVYITEAEQSADAGEWQAYLTKLMNPDDVPKIHVSRSENTNAAGDAAQTYDIACEITVNDVAFGCEFTFDVLNANAVDWDSVQQLLGQIVTEVARTSGSAPKPFAEAIHKALTNAMKDAQADETGNLPAWSNQNIALNTLRVSTPFYPELSVGKNGDATKRLQQKLIEQGFLIGGKALQTADLDRLVDAAAGAGLLTELVVGTDTAADAAERVGRADGLRSTLDVAEADGHHEGSRIRASGTCLGAGRVVAEQAAGGLLHGCPGIKGFDFFFQISRDFSDAHYNSSLYFIFGAAARSRRSFVCYCLTENASTSSVETSERLSARMNSG